MYSNLLSGVGLIIVVLGTVIITFAITPFENSKNNWDMEQWRVQTGNSTYNYTTGEMDINGTKVYYVKKGMFFNAGFTMFIIGSCLQFMSILRNFKNELKIGVGNVIKYFFPKP